MRHVVIAAGALAAIFLSASIASAQENNFFAPLSSPVAAPSNALELKVATGYTQGLGNVAPSRKLADVAGAGVGFNLDVDYRINPSWSVGVEAQYQEMGNKENSSVRGFATNIGATYHLFPAQVGDPFVRLGSGYRFLWENHPTGSPDTTVIRHGFDLATVKVGYDIRVSEDVAIAPVVGADLNMFAWEKSTGNDWNTYDNAQWSTYVYAGLQGRFDLGGTREGGRTVAKAPEPTYPAAAEIPAPPPPETIAETTIAFE